MEYLREYALKRLVTAKWFVKKVAPFSQLVLKIFTKKKVLTNLVVRCWIGGQGGLVGERETVSHLPQLLISKSEPTITRSTHSLLLAAHENTGPNYRKDVLQMLDMLT